MTGTLVIQLPQETLVASKTSYHGKLLCRNHMIIFGSFCCRGIPMVSTRKLIVAYDPGTVVDGRPRPIVLVSVVDGAGLESPRGPPKRGFLEVRLGVLESHA